MSLKDLREYLNRYIYLPRIKDQDVLIKAVQAAKETGLVLGRKKGGSQVGRRTSRSPTLCAGVRFQWVDYCISPDWSLSRSLTHAALLQTLIEWFQSNFLLFSIAFAYSMSKAEVFKRIVLELRRKEMISSNHQPILFGTASQSIRLIV